MLLDVDLRKPRVAQYTRTDGTVGLTDLLIGEAGLEDVVQRVGDTQLDVVAAGDIPPNPGELLASDAMFQFLATVKERYDFIILDTPPVLAVADAVGLASQVDGAILVAHGQRVSRSQVSRTLEALTAAGATPLGAVLNAVKSTHRSNENVYASELRAQPARRGLLEEHVPQMAH